MITVTLFFQERAELESFQDTFGSFKFHGADGSWTDFDAFEEIETKYGFELKVTGKADLLFALGRIDAAQQGAMCLEDAVYDAIYEDGLER